MARKVDTKEFIRRAIVIHGDKYDYSKSYYTKGKDSITITCKKHGDFVQRADIHLRGSGCPKCFQERNGGVVCGVGINDIGQGDMALFTTWRGMIFRCYDKKYNSAYSECEVCNEWKTLSNFAAWYYKYHKDGWQLDKDILGNGKLYSPNTCCFVPREINMCLIGKDSNGITFVKGKWQASFSQKYLGRYNNRKDAIMAHRQAKGKHIKDLAQKYGSILPTRVYDKLIEHALRLCGIEKDITL